MVPDPCTPVLVFDLAFVANPALRWVPEGMATHSLRPVCKAGARVLDHVTAGLSLGESRKIDNAPGSFMALCVECIGQTKLGPVFSFAHYYEQNGDLCCDPDCTILGADGCWYPLTFEQGGIAYQRVAEIAADGIRARGGPSDVAAQ